jgi:hypothetical protein
VKQLNLDIPLYVDLPPGAGKTGRLILPDVLLTAFHVVPDRRAALRRLKLQQKKTLQRLLEAIVWEWDNPYVDPDNWTPLEDEE